METVVDSTVAQMPGVGDTVLVDESARAGVAYAYRVLVAGLDEPLESNLRLGSLHLPPVQITGADFVSATATAEVTWTPYRGPHFEAYELRRRTADEADRTVATITDPTVTSHVDGGLHGNAWYHYWVAVLTERGEEIVGDEVSGIFHELLETWPLEVAEGGYVRLYAETDGSIAVLVAEPEEVRVRWLDAQGALLDDQVHPVLNVEPRSVAMALLQDGRRCVARATPTAVGLMALESDGSPREVQIPLFTEEFAEPLAQEHRGMEGSFGLIVKGGTAYSFDWVSVSSGGSTVMEDDFCVGTSPEWTWVSQLAAAENGRLAGTSSTATFVGHAAVRRGMSLSNPRAQAGLAAAGGIVGIEPGGAQLSGGGSRFRLMLDDAAQVARLEWLHYDGSSKTTVAEDYEEPIGMVDGATCRLTLEVVEGQVRAWAESPAAWATQGRRKGDGAH